MKQNEDKNIGILKGKCLALVPQMKVLKDSDWNKVQKRILTRCPIIESQKNFDSYMFVDYLIGCVGGNKECLKFIEAFVNTLNDALKYEL